MSEFISPSESELIKKELEEKDPRAELLVPGPDRPLYGNELEDFERQKCAQIFDIRFHPDGRIVVEQSLNLFLPEANRREWESPQTIPKTNPQQFEENRAIERAIADLTQGKKPELRESVLVPGARVAFGTCYHFRDPETQKENLVIHFTTNPNNVYKDWGNPSSDIVSYLHPNAHPGDLLARTFEEIIPCNVDEKDHLIPYWPSTYHRIEPVWYQRYKDKARTVVGLPTGNNSMSAYRELQAARPVVEGDTRIPRIVRATFETLKLATPIGFEFPAVGDKKPQIQNANLITTLNPTTGAFECQQIVHIAGKPPAVWLDPEFGTRIAIIEINELARYADEIFRNTTNLNQQKQGLAVESPPELKIKALIDGATGQPAEQSPELGFNRQTMTLGNFRPSPPLWAIAEAWYRQKEKEWNR